MKKFTIPMSNKLKRHARLHFLSFKLYSWQDSKFILEINDPTAKDHSNFQYFILENELIPFLTKRSEIPFTDEDNRNGFKRIITNEIRIDKDKNFYITFYDYVFKIPTMERLRSRDINFFYSVQGGYYDKSKNKGIILKDYIDLKSSFFIGERSLQKNELILLNYCDNLVCSLKTMTVTDPSNEVCAVKISNDGLLACAVVKMSDNDWELVLIDLE